MKQFQLIYCLFALGVMMSGCKPGASTQGISLSAQEICDPAGKESKGCLALDDKHAVLLGLADGQLRLQPLSSDSLQFGKEKGFTGLRTRLLRSSQGHRFQPKGTMIRMEKDQLVFGSEAGADFNIPASDLKSGFVIILSDGDQVVVSTYNTNQAPIVTVCKPIDLTEKVHEESDGECTRITISDKICLTSLGVIEILDNAIDPDMLVRVRIEMDFIEELLNKRPDFNQNPTPWTELDAKGFQKPAMNKPHAALQSAPVHFAAGQTDTPSNGDFDGRMCGGGTFETATEICRFRIGDKKLLYCNHALYSADDAAGTNKTLILSLNQQGCDLCFSREGDCMIIKATNLSTCVDGDFCAGLEPCSN
jgi:hypothetical protein